MTRTVGRYGLRPSPEGVKWAMRFGDYIEPAALPPIPAGAFGHTNKVTVPWGVMMNTTLGCCVVAGAQHETMLWVAESGGVLPTFSDNTTVSNYELLGNYQPGNPNSDEGCDMLQAAQLRISEGIVDDAGKRHCLGVALQLDCGPGYLNMAQFWYGCYYFDGMGLGIGVTEDWETDFQDGIPWDAADYNSDHIIGGHYVPAVARVEQNMHGQPVLMADIVTWGELQQITQAGLQVCTNRVLVYATEEKLANGKDLQGLSWSDMRSDIAKVTRLGALRGIHRL